MTLDNEESAEHQRRDSAYPGEVLPWRTRSAAELVRLSWPIAVSMLSYATMTLVDTLFVGRLGTAALAGVGLGGTAAFGVLCFGIGLLQAVKVQVSQSIGAGRRSEAKAYLGAGLWVALGLGLIMVLVAIPVSDVVYSLSATREAGGHAQGYLRVRMLGAPAVMIYVALREARYGEGDSRSPMYAAGVANVANIALDWLLIVKLEMGSAGAGLASSIGHAIEASILLYVQRCEGFGLRAWTARHLRGLFRVGIPTGVQFLLEVGSFALLASMIAAYGERDMAAHQIAIQVVHFGFLPIVAVGDAASILAGQAIGARCDSLVRVIVRDALLLSGAWALLCTSIIALGAEPIVFAFGVAPDLAQLAVHLLWVAAVFQLGDAANIVARCVLRGTGDVRVPAVICITTAWLCTPPLTWLFGYNLQLGALGGWLAITVEIFVGASLLWWRLGGGHWRAAAEASRLALVEHASAAATVT